MLAIETTQLSKTYFSLLKRRARPALRGIDLKVEQGAIFGLIGLNGAGKTTFIKTLLAVVRPDTGDVKVFGGSPEDVRIRRRIGYLPERLQLPLSFTPRDFLLSIARIKRINEAATKIDHQLDRIGLIREQNTRIGEFSKGMQRRVGVAAALLGEPDLLVLDEPTDGVDPLGRIEIRRILERERERGATVFLNSHLLTETEKICDHVGIISGGEMVKIGAIDEIRSIRGRWKIRFSSELSIDQQTETALLPGRTPLEWLCDAPDPCTLNQILDRLRASGAQLVGLEQGEQDLEDVLTEVEEKNRP